MSKADEQENLNTYIPSLTPSPPKKKKKHSELWLSDTSQQKISSNSCSKQSNNTAKFPIILLQ